MIKKALRAVRRITSRLLGPLFYAIKMRIPGKGKTEREYLARRFKNLTRHDRMKVLKMIRMMNAKPLKVSEAAKKLQKKGKLS